MDFSVAYVYIDKIEQDMKKDCSGDDFISALQVAKRVLREKITGFAECE